MVQEKAAVWRERKLPSGDVVYVTRYRDVEYVSTVGLSALAPFVDHLPCDVIGGKRRGYAVLALRDAVNEAVKREYAEAREGRAAALRRATLDVAKLVELTSPKAPPRKVSSELLFELPPQDAGILAEKARRRGAAARKGAAERRATDDAKKLTTVAELVRGYGPRRAS